MERYKVPYRHFFFPLLALPRKRTKFQETAFCIPGTSVWTVHVSGQSSQSINQSINTFITRHGTEARATVRIMPKQSRPTKKCKVYGKLILRKIIENVATRCHILKLKCNKFDFGWGSAQTPLGQCSHDPIAGFKGAYF